MLKRTNPITRLVQPSQAQAQPAPEEEPELEPTVKMSRFISYGD